MMKCERCGKNEATFYYKSNINGRVTEKHLCQDCAAELGYTASFRPMRLFDDSFFRPFGMLEGLLGDFGGRLLTEFPAPEESVRPVNEQAVQENLVSREEQETLSRQRQKNALEAQLKDAVAREDFESAIRLRDELRQMRTE